MPEPTLNRPVLREVDGTPFHHFFVARWSGGGTAQNPCLPCLRKSVNAAGGAFPPRRPRYFMVVCVQDIPPAVLCVDATGKPRAFGRGDNAHVGQILTACEKGTYHV